MNQASTLSRGPRSFGRALSIFLVSFVALQQGWDLARGTDLERWVIDDATVRTSVALIDVLTPSAAATASGPKILAMGGGINVRAGCEGTELCFLLVAALLAYPFSRRVRVAGLISGLALTFLLNQARLLALFYSFRSNRGLFELVHGLLGPLVLIACLLVFFVGLLEWDRRRADAVRG